MPSYLSELFTSIPEAFAAVHRLWQPFSFEPTEQELTKKITAARKRALIVLTAGIDSVVTELKTLSVETANVWTHNNIRTVLQNILKHLGGPSIDDAPYLNNAFISIDALATYLEKKLPLLKPEDDEKNFESLPDNGVANVQLADWIQEMVISVFITSAARQFSEDHLSLKAFVAENGIIVTHIGHATSDNLQTTIATITKLDQVIALFNQKDPLNHKLHFHNQIIFHLDSDNKLENTEKFQEIWKSIQPRRASSIHTVKGSNVAYEDELQSEHSGSTRKILQSEQSRKIWKIQAICFKKDPNFSITSPAHASLCCISDKQSLLIQEEGTNEWNFPAAVILDGRDLPSTLFLALKNAIGISSRKKNIKEALQPISLINQVRFPQHKMSSGLCYAHAAAETYGLYVADLKAWLQHLSGNDYMHLCARIKIVNLIDLANNTHGLDALSPSVTWFINSLKERIDMFAADNAAEEKANCKGSQIKKEAIPSFNTEHFLKELNETAILASPPFSQRVAAAKEANTWNVNLLKLLRSNRYDHAFPQKKI